MYSPVIHTQRSMFKALYTILTVKLWFGTQIIYSYQKIIIKKNKQENYYTAGKFKAILVKMGKIKQFTKSS